MTENISEINIGVIDRELTNSVLDVLKSVDISTLEDVEVEAGYFFDRKSEKSTSHFNRPNLSYCSPSSDDIIIRVTVVVPRYKYREETGQLITDVVSHEQKKEELARQARREEIASKIAQLQSELESIAE